MKPDGMNWSETKNGSAIACEVDASSPPPPESGVELPVSCAVAASLKVVPLSSWVFDDGEELELEHPNVASRGSAPRGSAKRKARSEVEGFIDSICPLRARPITRTYRERFASIS